jgi:predicted acyltransferase (DUF342 family)
VATALPAGPGDGVPTMPEAVRWDDSAGRGVSEHSLEVPAAQRLLGDLVCRSQAVLGAGCHLDGSLKVHGQLIVGSACRIHGNVVAQGRIELGERCAVRGSVVSETAIVIGPGCRIGAPEFPATVTAPRIDVAPGVVVHGTLWAGRSGRSRQQVPLRGLRTSP